LEIINEINQDASKESYYENNSIINKLNKNPENNQNKTLNDAGISNKSQDSLRAKEQPNKNKIEEVFPNTAAEIKNKASNILNNKENGFDHNADKNDNLNLNINKHVANNTNINNNNNDSLNDIVSNDFIKINNKSNNSNFNLMSNYNSENVGESPDPNMNLNNQFNNMSEIHKNYASHQGFRSNQPAQTRLKKPQGAKEERWKSIKITSIIAERVLLSNQEGINLIEVL
jgi:hypothetical protein